MKVLVVGCGKVGSEIARDLARENKVTSVTAADANPANLAPLKPYAKITTVKASLEDKDKLQRLMADADVVCGALPGRIGYQLLEAAVEVGKNIVDISYTPKDPFQLDRRAKANNCIIVPQCGVAPGLSNMLVGDASTRLDQITHIRIYVGGLPQQPVPPLNYRIVFSLDDVINEYTRPVHIIQNGTPTTVEPLSGLGHLNFPTIGKLEYFLTDGLGTLTTTFPNVREMQELTMRYPGHAAIMNTLRLLKFFDTKPITVDGTALQPRKLALELLRDGFSAGTPEDLLVLQVEIEGTIKGKHATVRYQLLDRYDKRHHVTAMARTTAYPCTSVALILGAGKLREKGVVAPEKIAQNPELFSQIQTRLKKHGVNLKIRTA